ncbi:hypothetical protein K7432_003487 [Basidiobolus ranarum]|uniref:Uncharacterized protein n=1 Tax=Basidiobolus ranarum TaxID=34480 RepID=A0ABR2WZS9_9FUNG
MTASGGEFYAAFRATELEVKTDEVPQYTVSSVAQELACGGCFTTEAQKGIPVDPNVVIPMTTFSYHEYPTLNEHPHVFFPLSSQQTVKASKVTIARPHRIRSKISPELALEGSVLVDIINNRKPNSKRVLSDREQLRVFALENRLAKRVASI